MCIHMGNCSHEVCLFMQFCVYKSSICCLWLSKFRQFFNFVTPVFHFVTGIFLTKSVTAKRSTQVTFFFRSNSNSASDFNVIQDFSPLTQSHSFCPCEINSAHQILRFSLLLCMQHHHPEKSVLYRGI